MRESHILQMKNSYYFNDISKYLSVDTSVKINELLLNNTLFELTDKEFTSSSDAVIDNKHVFIKRSKDEYRVRYLINEYIVNSSLNKLNCINFNHVYGLFNSEYKNYLFTVSDYIPHVKYDEILYRDIDYILSHFMQVVLALYYANKTMDYTHYNLTHKNVLIKPCNNISIKYLTPLGYRYINTEDVSIVINHKKSYIKNNKLVNNKSFVLLDVYTFLYSLTQLLKHDEKYRVMKKLLKFFIVDNVNTVDYSTIDEFIIYFMQIHPNTLTIKPKYKVSTK